MAKKVNKKSKKINVSGDTMSDAKKIVISIVSVVAIFFVFFLITVIINNNKNKSVATDEAVIQYTDILIGKLLAQNPNEYYVLVRNGEENKELFNMYAKLYKDKSGSLNLYNANLTDVFNKQFLASESNLIASPVSDIRFKTETLVKVSNKQAVSYFEGKEAIVNEFKRILK